MPPEHPYLQTWDDGLTKEKAYKSQPLNQDIISAIKGIAPEIYLISNEPSRLRCETDRNAASWGVHDALNPVSERRGAPAKDLELVSGFGRSARLLGKKLNWTNASGADRFQQHRGVRRENLATRRHSGALRRFVQVPSYTVSLGLRAPSIRRHRANAYVFTLDLQRPTILSNRGRT